MVDELPTILHLSDLHVRDGNHRDVQIVLDALRVDLDWWRGQGVTPDLICFTGDIAYSGKAEEYALARAMLFDPLLETLHLDRDRVFWVPGNHDVDRDRVNRDRLVEIGLASALRGRDEVNALLDDAYERELALRRLSAYAEFTRAFYGTLLGDQDPAYFIARSIRVRETTIGVACLNSAWRCSGTTDERRLVIGERQLRDARRVIGNAQLRIALVHHPFAWLRQDEELIAEDYCTREFHLVLSGHLHAPRIRRVLSPQGNIAYLPSGALFSGRRPEHLEGYSLIRLGDRGTPCTAHLRRYVAADRFDLDVASAPGGSFAFSLDLSDGLETDFTAAPVAARTNG